MQLEISKNNKDLNIKILGPLNTITAKEFLDKVMPELDVSGRAYIDLSQMAFTSSAGLRAFLTIQNALEREDGMTLIKPVEEVMEIFSETGLDRIFNIVH